MTDPRDDTVRTMASVLIPAHNEAAVIGRLLTSLTAPGGGAGVGDLEITVICNGCTDETARVASGFDHVRIVETDTAGKANALRLGNESATTFPRIYVDADVVIGRRDIESLVAALQTPGILGGRPEPGDTHRSDDGGGAFVLPGVAGPAGCP